MSIMLRTTWVAEVKITEGNFSPITFEKERYFIQKCRVEDFISDLCLVPGMGETFVHVHEFESEEEMKEKLISFSNPKTLWAVYSENAGVIRYFVEYTTLSSKGAFKDYL